MLLASDRPNRHRPSSWPADESFALPIGVGRTAPRKSALIRPRRGAGTDERSRAYAARASSCLPVICLPPLFRGLTASPACSPAVASPVEATRPHGCASKIYYTPSARRMQPPPAPKIRLILRHGLRPGRNRLNSTSFPPVLVSSHSPTSFPPGLVIPRTHPRHSREGGNLASCAIGRTVWIVAVPSRHVQKVNGTNGTPPSWSTARTWKEHRRTTDIYRRAFIVLS